MLFTKTISVDSQLPPGALLDRIRAVAAGTLPVRSQPRWRARVKWRLQEQPGGFRLMPLSPPSYLRQQPSFRGTIAAEDGGSRVTGRVTPYALTVGILIFLLLMDAALSIGGIAQELSRHRPNDALAFALFGVTFLVFALSMLQLGVSWAAADVRRLLETAAR